MKKLAYIILSVLFFAFTFNSPNMPPGWYLTSGQINDEITSICYLDTLTGWAVTKGNSTTSDTGRICKTTNGGESWIEQYVRVDNFVKVKFFDYNTGYVFGGTGTARFYKTTNGGTNWIENSTGIPIASSNDMFFINQNTGWLAAAPSIIGGLCKTTNGGTSWQLQMNQSYQPKKVFFVGQDTGWVLSNYNKLYKTVNGGTNWNLQYTTSGNTSFQYIFFINNKIGITTGFGDKTNNGIYKTTNGGDNWFRQTNSVLQSVAPNLTDIFMLNDSLGWIGTANNQRIAKYTRRNGWGFQVAPAGIYNCIFFFDSTKGIAGGEKFITTSDGGGAVTDINENSNQIVSDYKLEQNYPNPFNPLTRINYELKITNYVTLKVYDLQGKEIAVLVNERKNAGSYTVEFDAGRYNLSSGIYFYTLQTESFKETRKMILMK